MSRSKILLIATFLFIIYATTVPFDFSRGLDLSRTEWVPFWDGRHHRRAGFADMVQNVVLFMPLGFFALTSWTKGLRAVLLASLAGALLSGAVEVVQTMSPSRTSSITDLIMNSSGTAFGALIGLVYMAQVAQPLQALADRLIARSPELAVFCCVFAIAALVLWSPFIPSLDISALRHHVRALIDAQLFDGGLGRLVPDAFLFAGLGGALARTVSVFVPRRGLSVALSALGVVILSFGAELGQLFLVYRHASLGDFLADAVGGLAGVLCAMVVAPSAGILGVIFAIGLPSLRALAPFELVPLESLLSDIRLERLLPFSELFENLRLSTFSHVIETASCYAPLGFVIAARGRSTRVAFLGAVILAEVLEVLQLPIAGRTFDLGEAGLGAFGAVVGAWAFRRIFGEQTPSARVRG
ncbi:MAG: VanZ family protein [Myxococcota bacterium]